MNGDNKVTSSDLNILYTVYGNTCQYLSGDFNLDGVVDATDYALFNLVFNTTCSSSNCPADLNFDGVINVNDFLIFSSQYGQTCDYLNADFDQDGIVDLDDSSLLYNQIGNNCLVFDE